MFCYRPGGGGRKAIGGNRPCLEERQAEGFARTKTPDRAGRLQGLGRSGALFGFSAFQLWPKAQASVWRA